MKVLIYTVVMTLMSWRCARGDGGGNWGYHAGRPFSSPDHWKDAHDTSCGGNRQSPININKKTVVYSSSLKPITVSQGETSNNVSLKTTATSLYLTFGNKWKMSINEDGCLRPVSIHWHWGSKDSLGSEHTIDDVAYPIEGHLVTYNCQLYSDFNAAKSAVNGLYVFGVLYQIGEMNPMLQKLMPYMDTVINNGTENVPEIPPFEFLPKNYSAFYRYDGSLTTPPCTENVVWTVFHEIQTLNNKQLSKFRSLQFSFPEDGPMMDNFRPIQPMKGVVYSSFKVYNGGYKSSYGMILIVICILATIYINL